MDRLDAVNLVPDTRIEIQVPQKQEYRLIGSIRKVKGLRLFAYNFSTGELKEAEMRHEVMMGYKSDPIKKNKVNLSPNCLYVQALNKKVAWRKIMKHIANTITKP